MSNSSHSSRSHILSSSSDEEDEKTSIYSSSSSILTNASQVYSHRSFANLFREAIDVYDPKIKRDYKRYILGYTSVLTALLVLIVGIVTIMLLFSLNIVENVREPNNTSPNLYSYISVDNVKTHLLQLEEIAFKNGESRSVFRGYNQSVEYIKDQLQTKTGYKVWEEYFPITQTVLLSTPILDQYLPVGVEYTYLSDFTLISDFPINTNVNASVFTVEGEWGCEEEDFTGMIDGQMALLSTNGNCSIATKIENSIAANAGAILIYNSVSYLGPYQEKIELEENTIVMGITYALGMQFSSSELEIILFAEIYSEIRTDYSINLFAIDNVNTNTNYILIGSSLDSSPDSSGINDNGSGSAVNLELAIQLDKSDIGFSNNVKFAWWGAGYYDSLGSSSFLASLTPDQMYIDISNVGSPNFMRGVYDGNSAPQSIQSGCTVISQSFIDFMNLASFSYNYVNFTYEGDYANFLAENIVTGGVYSGTTEIKSIDQRTSYGGFANCPFDPCYRLPCDTVKNINLPILAGNSFAYAYTLQYFGQLQNLHSNLYP